MSNKNSDYYFLSGGGEMGALIRAKDWSKTSLGDPADWPQSLRTMVAVMLDNPFSMYIAWGSEYIQLYNDGYRPILGTTKHPQALGISTRETFSEIWHIIESMFDGVMKGKAVGFPDLMLPLNRNGFVEECYFDFSCSSIRKDNGEVGGVLVTVIETTNKKKTEESLKLSNERFRNTMKQAPVGITILRGPEYIVEMANDAYLQLVDKKEADFVGIPLFTSLPEVEEAVHSLLDNVLQTGVTYHGNEVPVPVNRYGKQDLCYFDFLYHPLKDEDGKISGIIVSATEVTDKVETRKKIEDSKDFIRESKERLEFILESAKGGDWDLDLVTGKANTSFLHDQCFGSTEPFVDWNYEKFLSYVHPEDRDNEDRKFKEAVSSGGDWSIDYRVIWKDGTVHWIQSSGRNYRFIDGKPTRMLGMVRDVTEQKEAQKQIKDSQEQLQTVFKQAPAAIALIEGAAHTFKIANSRYQKMTNRSEEQMLGKTIQEVFPELEGSGTIEIFNNVFKTGQPFSVAEYPLMVDINNDGIVQQQYFNFIAEPIKAEGKVASIMVIIYNITEQVEARKKIEDSEKRYNLMLMQSPFAFLILKGKDMVVHLANATMKEVLGKGNDIEGKPLLEVIPEIKGQPFPDLLDNVYTTGVPFSANEMLAQLTRNGILEDVYFNYVYQPYHEADNTISGVTVIAYDVTSSVIANKKVEQSEQRFRLALAGSNQIVFSQDKNLIHTWIYNPHPDFEQNDIIGKSDKDLHVPETASLLTSIKQKVLDSGNAFNGDIEIEVAGKKANYTLHIEAIKDSEGNITGIIGTSIDITERIKIEQRIKESEEQFSTLADNMENLAWMANADGWIYWYNSRWYQYTGTTPEQMEGWGWKAVHDPIHLPKVLEKWEHSINSGEPFEMVFPLKGADNIFRPFLTLVLPLRDDEGKIIRWIGTNTDISVQKEAEEQFRQMAERMPQKVWTADAHGNRNYFNQVLLDYTGLTFEELKDWGWKKIIHPQDWPHTKQKWEHCINTGEDYEHENRLLRKDGKYLWHLVRATTVKDERGRTKMWIGSSTEIQEQIELSETLGEDLKRSNERMQTILQHAPDAIISIDEDGIIKSWNSEAELIFGWKDSEVIGKTLTETIIPKRYRAGHDKGMKHFLRTGEGPVINKPVELSALKKNGSEFPVELKISTSKINDRYIFIGFVRDISIRKEAEETIQNKTNQLMEAQQLAHIGSWEWDVRANKINWSDELYRIYGLAPQEFEADYENFIKYVYPDDREYVNAVVQQAFKDHQPYSFFHKAVSADGNVRILNATGKVFADSDGNVIRMSGTAQDVTEQKRYEEELKISEERFFKIFDSNPIPMTLSEIKTNKIKYANNLFYNAFGYTKEEVIGNSSEEMNLMDPEEHKRVIDLIFGYIHENRSLAEIQALSKEETEAFLLRLKQSEQMKDLEIRYTRKNGETFPAIVSFELIRIGTESYTVTSYQDITERKKSEILLKKQNDELEKMNKELESFAYVSSHDLQEPLRKIQTFASRITEKEGNNLSAYGKDLFNRMQDAAQRMQTLIQDLLAYSRTNTTERNFEITDLNEIVAEIKEDLKEELQEKHAIIEANQLCDAKIIPFQFRQLLHNLIGNSLKFSNPNHPPRIQIKSEIANGRKLQNEKLLPQNKYCHITVSDNGIGFEEQYNEKIFEVFQRLNSKKEYNGTGIGLSIVKKIVENHHGIVTAKGELNKGATFEIYIPAT